MSCLLAFDTSTEVMAAGLAVGGRSLHRLAPGGAQASAGLLPLLHAVLAEAGIGLAALDAIAFGRGPGAFTGLRTSCAVAQGLGLGLDRPLLPLDSLLVVAEDARRQAGCAEGEEIGVVMDARMQEAYAARYRWAAGGWKETSPPALYTLPALQAAWGAAPPSRLCGSGLAVFGDALPFTAAVPQVPAEADRAAALLALAQAAWAAGAGIDAAAALPLYLRDKVALTTREREAQRAAS